ncbi:hypothetical protein [Streptomyces sp. MUM 2J]|uniref:hypothetical protein n=1 Tax=Streptomyces sp. MUM 2J TaxID=2791987 RepID=UPI001F039D05|nr:hypothetical protein [Streptomyces sp. MUM 2J]MCH0567235.1 hypothetical protein [Streptomyces sp. MUM 2J]
MPAITNLKAVPLNPLYTIVISTDEEVTIDGQQIDKLPGQNAREAALADIRQRAARRGHPVRANAKEPDGTVWPLIVGYDGAVTLLDAPHPAPSMQQAQTPSSASDPLVPPPATGEPVAVAPAGRTTDWLTPLPSEFQQMLAQLKEAESAGQLAAADMLARDLEEVLEDGFGPAHPYTVNVRSVRAYLALRMGDWRSSMDLHLQAAERRHQQQAPRGETLRLARNAHFCWKHLAKPPNRSADAHDQAMAAEWVGEVLRVLRAVGTEPVIIAVTEQWAACLKASAS